MADNGFKINKSVNLNPQAGTPSNPVDGDIYYDSVIQSFAYYHNGAWANFDSVGTVASTLWLTSAHLTPAIVRNSIVKITGGGVLSHLAGISASFSGRTISIYNAGTATIVVEPNDANEATVNNRIQTPTGGSMNLVAGEIAVFTYDVVASRWLLVSISSNAGAQVIATTSNPGLVTLHQASLLPLDGVVLSDGDLNTANGVVGLNANRAVNIAAPLSSVTAVTITANGASNAVDLFGSIELKTAGSAMYVFGGTILAGEAPSGIDGGKLVLSLPHPTLDGGLIQAWTRNVGVNESIFKIEESTAGVQVLIMANATNGSYITAGGISPLTVGYDAPEGWRFEVDGSISKLSSAAQIHNVADPSSAQDVATKNYTDTNFLRITGSTTQTVTGVKTFTGRMFSTLSPGASNANIWITNSDTTNDSNALRIDSSSVGTAVRVANSNTGRALQVQSAVGSPTLRVVAHDGSVAPSSYSGVAGDIIFVGGIYNKLYVYDGSTWNACW